jgi:hypothetical protein
MLSLIRTCRSHAALIHTCHAAPLPFSDSAVSLVKDRAVDGNIRTASPATTLYSNNLRGTPRGSRKKPNAGRSPTCRLRTADANSHIPCRSHVALCCGLEKSLSERHGRGMAWERHGRGMACVNQTRPHCVNQMGKTQFKPLAERHGMWELACKRTEPEKNVRNDRSVTVVNNTDETVLTEITSVY